MFKTMNEDEHKEADNDGRNQMRQEEDPGEKPEKHRASRGG